MKRIGLLIVFLISLWSTVEVRCNNIVKSCLSPDSTMIYEYHKSRDGGNFVMVRRISALDVSEDDCTTHPWWASLTPDTMIRHWKTYGSQVDTILDKLKIGKGSLSAILFVSLRTKELVSIELMVADNAIFALDRLPVEDIFSIYESISPSQYITVFEHQPSEEDDKMIIIEVLCR